MRLTYEQAVKMGVIKKEDVPKKVIASTKKKNRDLEGEEQAEVVKDFRDRYLDVGHLLIHIPNGGSRKNKFEGWRLKQQGTRAGVSDLHLPVARGGYFGLWMEFKANPPFDAAVQPSQQEWLDLMTKQGYYAVLCKGPEEAIKTLSAYMALSPTKIQKPKETTIHIGG